MKIIIYGLGYMAEVMHYLFLIDSKYEVAGFVIDKVYKDKDYFLDLPVIEFEKIEDEFPSSEYKIFIAVGYKKCNRVRAEKYNQAKSKGYKFVNYISSKAIVFDDLEIGENCCVLEGAIIQPCVKLGNNIIMRTGATVGHHTIIAHNCFLGPNSVVLGAVQLGENCFVGANATIREYVKVASDCVIGANSLIVKNTNQGEVYKPSPSVLSSRKSYEIRGLD